MIDIFGQIDNSFKDAESVKISETPTSRHNAKFIGFKVSDDQIKTKETFEQALREEPMTSKTGSPVKRVAAT